MRFGDSTQLLKRPLDPAQERAGRTKTFHHGISTGLTEKYRKWWITIRPEWLSCSWVIFSLVQLAIDGKVHIESMGLESCWCPVSYLFLFLFMSCLFWNPTIYYIDIKMHVNSVGKRHRVVNKVGSDNH